MLLMLLMLLILMLLMLLVSWRIVVVFDFVFLPEKVFESHGVDSNSFSLLFLFYGGVTLRTPKIDVGDKL